MFRIAELTSLYFLSFAGLPGAASYLRSDLEFILGCYYRQSGDNVTLLINNTIRPAFSSSLALGRTPS